MNKRPGSSFILTGKCNDELLNGFYGDVKGYSLNELNKAAFAAEQ